MNEITPYFKQIKFATLITCLVTGLFFVFFNVCKHNPALAAAEPFVEDPYDAVGSFGIQLALLAALVSLVRIFRPYQQGIASSNLLLILHGDIVSLAAAAVTLGADLIAMIRHLPDWTGSFGGWLPVLLMGGLMILTVLAGGLVFRAGRSLKLLSGNRSWPRAAAICLVGSNVLFLYPEGWREGFVGGIFTAVLGMAALFVFSSVIAKLVFPPVEGPYEDFLDDLTALYRWLKAKANRVVFLFRWLEKLANISWVRSFFNWLNPREHAWTLLILVAVGMGLALVVAESISEGAPQQNLILILLSVFIGIEGVGVVLGYLLFRQFLGIFRS